MTTRLEDTLTAAGYQVATEIEYVDEADNVATNRSITTSIAVLGFLIVAISMVGLANAITMNVIERTREIGILRCVGARARDVRRIFATEGVAIAVGGWLLGIPVGYLLDRFLVWLLREVVNIDVARHVPAPEHRAGPCRDDPHLARDHAAAAPARCALQAGRRARLRLSGELVGYGGSSRISTPVIESDFP